MEGVNKYWNPKTKLILLIAGFSILGLITVILFFQVNSLNNSLVASTTRIKNLENKTQSLVGDFSETSISNNSSTQSTLQIINNSSQSSSISLSSKTTSSNSSVSNVTTTSSINTSNSSLVGEKGDKGDKGDTGTKGDQGIQGIQGAPGISGYERICGNTTTVATGTTGGAGANCSSGKTMITYVCQDTANRAYLTGSTTDSINASILCNWWNVSGQNAYVKACIMCGYVN